MTLVTFFSVVVASGVYNMFVSDDTDAPPVTGTLPFSNETFYKIAASGGTPPCTLCTACFC